MKAFGIGVAAALALAVVTGVVLPAVNPSTPEVFYSEFTYPDAERPAD